jgi:hypothetical protein
MIKKKYFIYSDNPDKSIKLDFLINLLKKNKNWISSNETTDDELNNDLDFSYIIGRYENAQPTDISYRFTGKHRQFLTNKYILYKTIERENKELYEKFMVKHYEIDIDNLENNKKLFKNGKIIIIRPTWAFERSGIVLIDNFDSFKKYMEKKGKHMYENITKRKPRETHKFVGSEYIKNVLTHQNKVCDFRVFFLITLINGIYRAYLVKPIMMNLGQYERKEFNITHIKENITYAHESADHFMRDLKNQVGKKNYKFMKSQILHILSCLFRMIKTYQIMDKFIDQNNVYELFGLDFIADDKYNIKLIEFNEKTGLGGYSDEIYKNIANAFVNATINKTYDDNYKIQLDDNVKKNIIRIRSNKNYL